MTDSDVSWNLKARTNFSPIMDLREAHLLLKENDMPIDVEKRGEFTQVWEYMAKFMRAWENQSNWQDAAEARKYVRSKLGRRDGVTFLTELSPFPFCKGVHSRA